MKKLIRNLLCRHFGKYAIIEHPGVWEASKDYRIFRIGRLACYPIFRFKGFVLYRGEQII